ncbi:inverse autotransporter beta domain-containing protein [Bordetella avium]|uniref:inverse autotransporter beta domain-containing protein n=1 Tax=Bordetella avium TaxID=521 RepID=UPI000FDCA760|nr:inverse autotransporter beta domain-containing protein [Bordetella avium]AZY51763.1 adhesin [Bordetella avium]
MPSPARLLTLLLCPTLLPPVAYGSAIESEVARNLWTRAQHPDTSPGLAQSALDAGVAAGLQASRQTGLPWLRHLDGGLRYDLDPGRLSFSLRTIDDLMVSERRALMLQAGLHNQNQRPTANTGIVLRQQASPGLIVGSNAFLDYEFGKQHVRGSLGLEAIAPHYSLYANYYAPLSGWKGARRDSRREERPAAGYDLGGQLSSDAGLSLQAAYFRWHGAGIDVFDSGRAQRNASGFRYGVAYQPGALFNIGLNQTRTLDGQKQTSVQLNVRINLQEPLSGQLRRESQPFNLTSRRHKWVERESRIVLNTRRKAITLPLSIAQLRGDPTNGAIEVSGQTEAGARIMLTFPDGSGNWVRADASGRYTARSGPDMPSGTVRAQARNVHGDSSPEVSRFYTANPQVEMTAAPRIERVETLRNGLLRVSGRAAAGADIWAVFPDDEEVNGKAEADGSFILSSTRPHASGDILVTASLPDGGVSEASTYAYVKQPPGEPTVDAVSADLVGRLTIQGSSEAGAAIQANFPDGTDANTTADAQGRYTLHSPGAVLQSGDIMITASGIDGAVGDAVFKPYTPEAPQATITSVIPSTLGELTVSGLTQANAEVYVQFPDGSSTTVNADASGNYTAVSTSKSMPSGEIMVIATGRSAGVGSAATQTYTRNPPTAHISSATADTAGKLSIRGQTEPGLSVFVLFPSGDDMTVQADAQGNFHATSSQKETAGIVSVTVSGKDGGVGVPVEYHYSTA